MQFVEMKGKGTVQTFTIRTDSPKPRLQRRVRAFGTAIHQNLSKFKIDLKATPQDPVQVSSRSIQLVPSHRVQNSSRLDINMYPSFIQSRRFEFANIARKQTRKAFSSTEMERNIFF